MRLILLSDTHQLHRELELPPVDLLLHAGDWSMLSKSMEAVRDFDDWLSELSLRHKAIGVPGNHEYYLEADPRKTSLTPHLHILNATGTTIAGLKIWGSPTTVSYGGAFGLSDPRDRVRHWSLMPDDVDILITHGPPAGVLDNGHGDPELLAAVQRVQPKLHLFGHAHGAYGVVEREGTTFVNAALLGIDGDLANEPLMIEIG